MNNIMIDFETLSTDTKCIVLSIGMVAFDYGTLGDEFYLVMNREEQKKMGRVASQATEEWWKKQAGDAQKVLQESIDCGRPVREDLSKIATFIAKHGSDVKVWGNGAGFDINILEDLFKSYNITAPWKYWNVRDLRTFTDLIGHDRMLPKNPTGHNALSDAKWQASYIIKKMNQGTRI